jgi:hypothetical protein
MFARRFGHRRDRNVPLLIDLLSVDAPVIDRVLDDRITAQINLYDRFNQNLMRNDRVLCDRIQQSLTRDDRGIIDLIVADQTADVIILHDRTQHP